MGCVVNATHQPLYLRDTTRYPLYRKLGGPLGRSGRVQKSHPHRDSIPVGIRYANYAIPAHELRKILTIWRLTATICVVPHN